MADQGLMSGTELLRRIENGWNDFNAYLKTLTEAQLTQPTDAAGWTVKDHIIHLSAWEEGTLALLRRQSRREAMGVDEDTWKNGGFDGINAIIQQRCKDMLLEEVMRTFDNVHRQLVDKVRAMSDEDLQRPFRDYEPASTRENPVIGWIIGNTYEHYAEHQPWIAAIVRER